MIAFSAHKIIASSLTLILLSFSINNAYIIGNFLMNQNTIAKTLCVQKTEQKGCNGKCQLRKALNETKGETNTDGTTQNNERFSIEIVFVNTSTISKLQQIELKPLASNFDISNRKTITKFYDIETPPPLIS